MAVMCSRWSRLEMPVILRGFIDESYGGEAVPKIFSLSCMVANNSEWVFHEWDWVSLLESTNTELESQGRPRISRFHASDFSNSLGEFRGWSKEEKVEFSQRLIAIFRKHPAHIYGYDIPLQLMVDEMPETKANPLGFAYTFLLSLVMRTIADNTLKVYPDALITLHHDRCRYDAALLEMFNHLKDDPGFPHGNQFLYMTSEGWEHCIPLQPADFLAYENYKESARKLDLKPRDRRKSLEAFLDLESISGRSAGFTAESIKQLKPILEKMDEQTKAILYRETGVRQVRRNNQGKAGSSLK
jgi:hypothetical protein